MKLFLSKKILLIFSAIMAISFFANTVFAVWNGTFYEPGDTLNPECLPSDPDCDVRSPLTILNINDTAYGASWDADTTHAPSKNAVYDALNALPAVHDAVTLGTANGLSLSTQQLSLALASTSTTGALSDTDWDTFNNKVSSQWTTNGSDIHFNTGNVGIGVISPTQKLDIDGNIKTTGAIYLYNGVTSGGYFQSYGGVTSLTSQNSYDIDLSTNSQGIRINGTTGNVGIGTTSPAYPLDVNGTAQIGTTLRVDGTSAIVSLSGDMYFGSNVARDVIIRTGSGADRMFFDATTGNVGIGTTAPDTLLHLEKTGNASLHIKNTTGRELYLGMDGSHAYLNNPSTQVVISGQQGVVIGTSSRTTSALGSTDGLAFSNGVLTLGRSVPGDFTLTHGALFADTAPRSTRILGADAWISATTNINGGNTYIDGGAKSTLGVNGNVLIGTVNPGNVGIGTTSPTNPLTVQGAGVSVFSNSAAKIASFSNSTNEAGFFAQGIATNFSALVVGNSGDKKMSLNAGTGGSAFEYDSTGGFYIQTASNADVGKGQGTVQMSIAGAAPANSLTINASGNLGIVGTITAGTNAVMNGGGNSYFNGGNVGIGTTSPSAKLDILDTTLAGSGSLTGSALNIAQTWNTTGAPTAIKLNVTNTASDAASLLMDLQVGGVSKFNVGYTGAITTGGALFQTPTTYTFRATNSGAAGTAFTINPRTNSTTSGQVNGVSITPTYNQASGTASNTDLLINRTETAIGSGAQYLIDAQVGGVSKFSVTNTGVIKQAGCTTAGTLSADVSGNIICTPSSERFKNNINDLENSLSNIMALRPVSYNFNPDMNMGNRTYFGFISEEAADVVSEFASHDRDGNPYGLDTNAILAGTVKAIQEMNLTLEDVRELEGEVDGESFFSRLLAKLTSWLADAGNGIKNIFVEKVETKEICVSDESGEKTCITKAQLDALILNADIQPVVQEEPEPELEPTPSPTPSPSPSPSQEGGEEPTPEPEEAPEPEVTPLQEEPLVNSEPETTTEPAPENPATASEPAPEPAPAP